MSILLKHFLLLQKTSGIIRGKVLRGYKYFLHICCHRKLLKISWMDKVTNEEVTNLFKEKRSLYARIKRRRDRLIYS